MSEETLVPEEKQPEPIQLNQEEKDFKSIQNEFLQLCAQAGEFQFIISNNRKKLAKANFRLRKLDQKARAIIEHKRIQDEAKRNAATPLKVVPPLEETK